MAGIDTDRVLLRVFMGEGDRHRGHPLYHALLELLLREKITGATVLRGIAGFGESGELRTGSLLRLSQNLPIVLEAVDTEENIERVLPRVAEMVGGRLVTLERVRVVRAAPREA